MRFLNVPIVTFTTINGLAVQVRDKRPISTYATAFFVDIFDKDDLDEVASRDGVFGNNGESLTYSIIDNNVIKFIEFDFDISKIRRVGIPIVNE